MDLSAEIHIGWLCQKAKGHFALGRYRFRMIFNGNSRGGLGL